MKKIFLIFSTACLGGLILFNYQADQLLEKQLLLTYQPFLTQKPGLLLKVQEPRFKSKEVQLSTHVIEKLDLSHETFLPFQSENFTAEIRGFLKVPASDVYSLALSSKDLAILWIDGNPILSTRPRQDYSAKKCRLFLQSGFHYVRLKYTVVGGGAHLKLSWGKNKKPRHDIHAGETFQPQGNPLRSFERRDLPPNEDLTTGILAEEWVRLNQKRAALLLGIVIGLLLFFFGKKFASLFCSWEGWTAIAIFILAVALRWLQYESHLYKRIFLILDGGDNHYYLLLPLRFVTHGEWIHLNCGNLAILIPILGTLYKYFCFFPGLHYYSLLMIYLGAAVVLLPWMLLRPLGSGWAGLFASLFLAIQPSLSLLGMQITYVNTDLLGLITFSVAASLCAKAFLDERLSSFCLAGCALALMALTRTVFIPLAPVMSLLLFLLSRRRLRALANCGVFISLLLGFELLAYPVLHESYLMHFMREGFDATFAHRLQRVPSNLWQFFLWLPDHWLPFLKIMRDKLLPLSLTGIGWRWGMAVFLCLTAAITLKKTPRLFIFIVGSSIFYLYEISSYFLQERLLLPLFFMLALFLALGLRWLPLWHPRRVALLFLFIPFLLLGLWETGSQASTFYAHKKEQKKFLSWVKKEAPPKSIILADFLTDPWELQEGTGLPVFLEIINSLAIVVPQQVIPVRGVTFLAQQSPIPNPDPSLSPHHYMVNRIPKNGYHYIFLKEDYAQVLKEHDCFKNYLIEKRASYPHNVQLGIWELVYPGPVLKPDADFDRFLLPYKERSKT